MLDKFLYVKPMNIDNYEEIYEMWRSIPGIGVNDADTKDAITRYLERNPNLSYVYWQDDKIVATILGGHDGRRGYIHHTCVLPEYQGQGIGKILVEKVLKELKEQGISKCHLFVFSDNETGSAFWSKTGWEKRSDLLIYSKNTLV